jgi:hypothetical protein
MFHERDIYDQLSHPLQAEVALVKCSKMLQTLRVDTDDNLARAVAVHLVISLHRPQH